MLIREAFCLYSTCDKSYQSSTYGKENELFQNVAEQGWQLLANVNMMLTRIFSRKHWCLCWNLTLRYSGQSIHSADFNETCRNSANIDRLTMNPLVAMQ